MIDGDMMCSFSCFKTKTISLKNLFQNASSGSVSHNVLNTGPNAIKKASRSILMLCWNKVLWLVKNILVTCNIQPECFISTYLTMLKYLYDIMFKLIETIKTILFVWALFISFSKLLSQPMPKPRDRFRPLKSRRLPSRHKVFNLVTWI